MMRFPSDLAQRSAELREELAPLQRELRRARTRLFDQLWRGAEPILCDKDERLRDHYAALCEMVGPKPIHRSVSRDYNRWVRRANRFKHGGRAWKRMMEYPEVRRYQILSMLHHAAESKDGEVRRVLESLLFLAEFCWEGILDS